MFDALGRVMYRRRRWVVLLALLFIAFAGVWGTGVFGKLTGSGFEDPNSESSRASAVSATALGRQSASEDVVVGTTSFWTTASPTLVSADRHATYAILTLKDGKGLDRVSGHLAAPGLTTQIGG